jgi:hypothetical protein
MSLPGGISRPVFLLYICQDFYQGKYDFLSLSICSMIFTALDDVQIMLNALLLPNN